MYRRLSIWLCAALVGCETEAPVDTGRIVILVDMRLSDARVEDAAQDRDVLDAMADATTDAATDMTPDMRLAMDMTPGDMTPPADMAPDDMALDDMTPTVDMAPPIDMTRAGDMAPPPMDMAPPPVDMTPPPVDMAPPPVDMAPPPVDMAPPPVDMAPPPVDMAPPPVDMAPPPVDMAPIVDMAPPPLVDCPEFDNAEVLGNVADGAVVESSGVAESWRNPGVLWMHNDSGDGPRVFAIGTDGAALGRIDVDGGRPRDWEDLSVGPGPDPMRSYIYVGDVGDNASARADIRVRRLPEPEIPLEGGPRNIDFEGAESFTLVYPDGAHNCETLMVDPLNGDVYVVVKSGDGDSPVYRATAPLNDDDGPIELEHVADLTFGPAPLRGNRSTTGGDISRDGSEIIIRTYNSAYLWRRRPGATIAEALQTEPCRVPQAGERQGEAIGFAADGSGYYSVSEGNNQPIHYYRRR